MLGLLNGRIQPLVRGNSPTYERATQPGRFWASLSWNALIGAACLIGSFPMVTGWRYDRCFDHDTAADTAQAKVTACSAFLEATDIGERRAVALAERGIGYDWLGNDRKALADYSQALSLDPRDANTLYNRARIRARLGDARRALADYDASLKLAPRNAQGLINRGLVFLDTGQMDKAIADFTRAHEIAPANPWALANRGIAHAWKGDRALALADFGKARAIDPANPALLHGEATLDVRDGNLRSAIARLSEALRNDPKDQWALRMRADAYWKLGEREKARDDDDRWSRLREDAESLQRSDG